VSDHVDESNYDYESAGQEPGQDVTCFEGRSDWKVRSDERDFHVAVQRAAKAAARAAEEAGRIGDDGKIVEEWYEISRVRILVGNPNVKIFSVMIAPTPRD
jgi:hypothetical protein